MAKQEVGPGYLGRCNLWLNHFSASALIFVRKKMLKEPTLAFQREKKLEREREEKNAGTIGWMRGKTRTGHNIMQQESLLIRPQISSKKQQSSLACFAALPNTLLATTGIM